MLFLRTFEQSVQCSLRGTWLVQFWVGISSVFVRCFGNKSAYPEWLLDHVEWCSHRSAASSRSKLVLPSPRPALLLGAQHHAGPTPAAFGRALPQQLLPGPSALGLRPHPAAAAWAVCLYHQDALLILFPGDGGGVLCQLCQEKPNLPREKK